MKMTNYWRGRTGGQKPGNKRAAAGEESAGSGCAKNKNKNPICYI